MSKFTFLTEDQIFGSHKVKQLEIIKLYGLNAEITDFAILLGGRHYSGWWSKTLYIGDYDSKCVITSPNRDYDSFSNVTSKEIGARPAIPYSSISSNYFWKNKEKYGIKEIEYGEYPQSVVPKDLAIELEKKYCDDNLNITGKTYTTNSVNSIEGFEISPHIEYIYKGKKYIRLYSNSTLPESRRSDLNIIEKEDTYWVEVEPIQWIVDVEANIALSKKILFAGIPFHKNQRFYFFKDSDIKRFMDKHFVKDIIPSKLAYNKIYHEELIISPNDVETLVHNTIKRIINNHHLSSEEKKIKLKQIYDTLNQQANDLLMQDKNKQKLLK